MMISMAGPTTGTRQMASPPRYSSRQMERCASPPPTPAEGGESWHFKRCHRSSVSATPTPAPARSGSSNQDGGLHFRYVMNVAFAQVEGVGADVWLTR